MPKINQSIISTVFYLYRDTASAQEGAQAVGTGFVVEHDGRNYGVTNRHVTREQGGSVIRLNTETGFEIFDLVPEDWETIPGGEDIAAVSISPNHRSQRFINSSLFVDQHDDIGVGDDVFMIGLFTDHEGKEKNSPLARFGNISMLAKKDSPIRHGGRSYESYIVDMHSRSGFSGSPVFVYRTLGGDLTKSGERVRVKADRISSFQSGFRSGFGSSPELSVAIKGETMFKFLGIHWGQFPERWELREPSKLSEESKRVGVITDEMYVHGFSGMTCVAPAWKVKELLRAIRVTFAHPRSSMG